MEHLVEAVETNAKNPLASKTINFNALMLAITSSLAGFATYLPELMARLEGVGIVSILILFAVNNGINIYLRTITDTPIKK